MLEMVQVADQQRHVRLSGQRFGQSAPITHAGQLIVGREVVQARSLLDARLGCGDLLGEQAHRAPAVIGRPQSITWILDHDQPAEAIAAAAQRCHQAIVIPGQPPAALYADLRAGPSRSWLAFSR